MKDRALRGRVTLSLFSIYFNKHRYMAYVWLERLFYDPVCIDRNCKCLLSSLLGPFFIVFSFRFQDSLQ